MKNNVIWKINKNSPFKVFYLLPENDMHVCNTL